MPVISDKNVPNLFGVCEQYKRNTLLQGATGDGTAQCLRSFTDTTHLAASHLSTVIRGSVIYLAIHAPTNKPRE